MRNCNCRRFSNQNCNCRCQNNRNNYSSNMYNMNNSDYMNSNNNNYSCGCMNYNNNNNSSPFPSNYMYGYAYTPNQTMNELYNPQTGLENGSMFPELVSPYNPGNSMEFIEYLKTTGRNGGCGRE